MHKIEVMSFDLDNTLFDFRATLQAALAATVAWLQSAGAAGVTGEDLQEARSALVATPEGRAMKLLEVRRASMAQVLRGQGAAHLLEGAMDVFAQTRARVIPLFPEAEAVLRALSARYPLVALTNGNTNPDRSALAGVFETVIYCEDLGCPKPDPRAFQLVAEHFGLEDMRAICHVGDAWRDDVVGAKNAGCRAVWFNPKGDAPGKGAVPDMDIRALPELLALSSLRP